MINPKDLYTFTVTEPLGNFGTAIIQYDIRRYRDVRNLGNVLGYMVVCKQRIIIPNANAYQVGPNSNGAYSNYPAAITCVLDMKASNAPTIVLKDIFPRTLNASVNTSSSSQQGTSATNSSQSSSGSNTSQTNTFGVSLQAGFFGDVPMGGLTVDYQHGWESGSFSSSATGSEAGRQASTASAESMSVKDWSSYGFADSGDKTPTWIWGQSYPWDVIQYNQSSDGVHINLPSFVQARLLDGDQALPPSQLSLFGVDFTMKAGWLIEFPAGVTSAETISLSHLTKLFTASHAAVAGTSPSVSATLQTSSQAELAQYISPAIDLSTYALDPIWDPGVKNGAAIGFTADPFTYPPTSAGGEFKIVSPANNLQVEGSGFNSILSTTFQSSTSLTIKFKIVDSDKEYFLHLLHWIGAQSSACALNVTVNATALSPIYVDAPQGQGGQNNMTSIDLRNLDFTSTNYHDYLVLGLNTIQITIAPINPGASDAYTLFALAVGQA